MNEYQEKLELKRNRYLELAKRNREKSKEEVGKGVSLITDNLPAGQPILVGHHSEGKHRRLLDKSDNAMRRGIEADKKAEYYENKAETLGSNISLDDPDAFRKLKDWLSALEKEQEEDKKKNKLLKAYYKKEDRCVFLNAGYSEEEIDKVLTPDGAGDIFVPSCRLTNRNARIRRLKSRIRQASELEERKKLPPKQIEGKGYIIKENPGINRVQIIFEGKPSLEIRTRLKRGSFRWSPREGAWQRTLNNSGVYEASAFHKDMKTI